MDNKRALVARALEEIVEQARQGGPTVRVGLMTHGSELGAEEVLKGAALAMRQNRGLKVVAIGPRVDGYDDLDWIETPACEADIVNALESALNDGRIGGCVAMHYPFPIGVTTIGRVLTPGKGKAMYIASSTGSSASARVEAMIRNAVYGIATAKATGVDNPTVAVLNLDGAGTVLRALGKLESAGYKINFGTSARGDGGSLLRGNDVVAGAVDVLVCDTLTGNVMQKVFSSYTTGGYYESVGWGYGPSVGEGWDKVVSIISRSSGAQVIAGALLYTAEAVSGKLPQQVAKELAAAKSAGLDGVIADTAPKAAPAEEAVAKPAAVPVDESIGGVDVLDMDNAARELWKAGIYAETAMGCTGPVVRIPASAKDKSVELLTKAGYI